MTEFDEAAATRAEYEREMAELQKPKPRTCAWVVVDAGSDFYLYETPNYPDGLVAIGEYADIFEARRMYFAWVRWRQWLRVCALMSERLGGWEKRRMFDWLELDIPKPLSEAAFVDRIKAAYALFKMVWDLDPRDRESRYDVIGRPRLLAKQLGFSTEHLSAAEETVCLTALAKGESEPEDRGGPGTKRVRQVGTNTVWPSAKALALASGYSLGSVYAHLRGDSRYSTLAGRIFEYVPETEAPDPNDMTRWSEERKEQYRKDCRDAGFEPRI